jgi:hypothetical protein
MLQENLSTEYKITSILRPIASPAIVAEDLRNLGKDFTK